MARVRIIRFGNGRCRKTERPRITAAELYKYRSNVGASVYPASVYPACIYAHLDAVAQKGLTTIVFGVFTIGWALFRPDWLAAKRGAKQTPQRRCP